MNAERRFELGKTVAQVPALTGVEYLPRLTADDVVAEQKDRIGAEPVRFLDDALESLDRHPRLADMQVRKHSQPQLQSRRPARRRQTDSA